MRRVTLLVVAVLLMSPASAAAADPQRWTPTGTSSLPLAYWQGVTVDAQANLYFDGVVSGLYRTDPALRETGRTDDAIPASVRIGERYNHIGDISWDASEGGRLLLPLECYYPGEPNGGNTCLTGSIGVADAHSLQWRYYVKLDPTEIRKAMWNELSPDGELVWTSSGADLLAYRTADVAQANEGPAAAPIHSVQRLVDAVPPSGITGATFVGSRLLVAGQTGGPFQIWSIDLATRARRLEAEREIVGESEGLATASVNGGTLQWLIPPFDPAGRPPTYGPGHSTLLSLRPGPPDPPPPAAPPAPASAPPSAPSSPAGSPRVRLLKRSRAAVLRRRRLAVRVSCPAACTVRITARARGRTIARGSIRRSGVAPVRLTAAGRRMLRRRRVVRVTLRITVRDAAGRLTRRTLHAVLR